jgi:hypothetical protein
VHGPTCIFWAGLAPFSLQPDLLRETLLPEDEFIVVAYDAGMLTQGGQGGHPAPLASRLYRIPTHFLFNLHGI